MTKLNSPSDRFDRLEETLIAVFLGVMTLMTFANVVARYVFNSNIFYALVLTVFLFAWLVLLGASYAVKKTLHLGVDAVVAVFTPSTKRALGLFSVVVCVIYSLLLLKGAWDYWAPYANLPPTQGRILPLGFVEKYRGQGWYETQDIPVPFFLTWLADIFNDGEAYEKMPKVVPYVVLPISMLLLCIRFIQAGTRIWKGQQELLIVSHEAEDDVAEAAARLKEQD